MKVTLPASLAIWLIILRIGGISSARKGCTDVARDDETLLVFSTLGGGLTAVDPITSEIRWIIDDEPAVKVPTDQLANPQYLPDPRDGSLYELGDMGGLKKLPYTIPQLVASAPCRSSDGILYSGKKSDTWFLIDPKTGKREKVLDFGAPSQLKDKIGWATSRAMYLGRTQYTVMMYDSLADSKDTKPWNVTFFDYSSHTMAPEVSKEYEWLHLTASASGMTVTLDRAKGTFVWLKNFNSPVVATFLMGSEGLLSVPFTTVSDDTLKSIVEYARDGQKNDIKLFQTLYVGEHPNGLYAIPSLTDRNIATISSEPPCKLLGGPHGGVGEQNPNLVYLNELLEQNKGVPVVTDNIIVLGHYQVPTIKDDMKLSLSPSNVNRDTREVATTINDMSTLNINRNGGHDFVIFPSVRPDDGDANDDRTKSIGVQTLDPNVVSANNKSASTTKSVIANMFRRSSLWLDAQDSKILKMLLIILMGMIVAMFWYVRYAVRELRQSQTGSQMSNTMGKGTPGNSYQELIDLGDGDVRVGKIMFNCGQVLGKGCEGTFVFKGTFEKRNVAVKRLLPECFTLADREVSLLRESDAHENVVRYFCTEQDRQFKYIAVELCAATLQDYIESGPNSTLQAGISPLDVLKQATSGLMHLHSLHIVHRDIKPQNVLLSQPNVHNQVRAMISDFGLCKKLNYGKTSFSRRSGITGTEGWIAPEMLKGQRTTTSVDIFSLGCVYYYVLSNGSHPFGEAVKRQLNILSFDYDLRIFKGDMYECSKILAEQLIVAMISKDPMRRPPTKVILNHPFFWNEDRTLNFLQDVSDRVEKLDYSVNPLKMLEKNGKLVVRDDWNIHLHESITADLRKYRGYHGNSVRDLLRALRNKKHHYHELTSEMKAELGAIPVGFIKYWTQRFPHLVSHAYHALESCSRENLFKTYYSQDAFTFQRPDYFYAFTDDFVPPEAAPKRDSPVKRYSKEMRQRVIERRPSQQQDAIGSSAANTDLHRRSSPPPNKRGSYNFSKPREGQAMAIDSDLNWRRPKNTPNDTIAWTLPNANA